MGFNNLVSIFEDTQKVIEQCHSFMTKTQQSIEKTIVYKENFVCEEKIVRSETIDNIIVVPASTYECALNLVRNGRKHIAVLNFANPYEPGGGVKRGARAQEECLCRCSNLYNVISNTKCESEYYEFHKANKGYLFSDRVIYSPDIIVLKNDDYELLENSFNVDVITCAAPYNVYGHNVDVLKTTYKSRIKNILEVAIENGVDTIVLGAFGCGAFHNPPQLMAEAFKSVLVDEQYAKYFGAVYFAIIKPKSAFDRNLQIFTEILDSNSGRRG